MGICYFSAKHAALRRKSKDWNQDDVLERGNMSIRGLLFHCKNPAKLVSVVQSRPHRHLIEN